MVNTASLTVRRCTDASLRCGLFSGIVIARAGLHAAVAILLMSFMCSHALAHESGLPVAGWIERAVLLPSGVSVHAKLDTGADTSSINAVDVESFERENETWQRFSVTNRDGRTVTLERPVVRAATVKRHYGGKQERPVIELDICVGPARKTVEVSLVDRSGLKYQLLIGRNFLDHALLVDSGHTYLLSPECPAD